jgi:GT2 family glycosyltransferase/glycosyltransferase involved in cell wall biosynthesis
MWPLNLPARKLLKLQGMTWITWAIFDVDWYLETYSSATSHLADATADAVLAFYLNVGQGLSHSPNMLFDEVWHRCAYPEVVTLIMEGQFESAFDAYCGSGCLARSPHWLFDELHYRRSYPDLTDEALAEIGLVNGYDHYLWHGSLEGRTGHPLFDPDVYHAQCKQIGAEILPTEGPFRHCLRRISHGEPEVQTSIYFDPIWYLEHHTTMGKAIVPNTWRWVIEHYICNASPTQFDPIAAFSELYYLDHNPDVLMSVNHQDFRNGFAHFLLNGIYELRSPSENIDLAWYSQQESVRKDLERGVGKDAFTHWLTIGRHQGIPSKDRPPSANLATALAYGRASTMSLLFARSPISFEMTGAPVLSVIMVLHNRFPLTLMALASLRMNCAANIEVILIDCGSTDETLNIRHYVRGAIYLRFDIDISYLRSRNVALHIAKTDMVLYLHNDIELAPGAITAALRRMESDPKIGSIGGMIIGSHGVLQEAGGIVWRDGTTQGYMRDASPLTPEANFTRDVDFCSGIFLMARRALLDELEGFDEELESGHYADIDLCVRINRAGFRVVYDPSVVLYHLDQDTAQDSYVQAADVDYIGFVFAQKQADYLMSRHAHSDQTQVYARTTDTSQRRVLFLEDTIPLRTIGSGFVRSNDLVRTMVSMGYCVTVYPLNDHHFDPACIYADMPDNVEVMYRHSLRQLEEFLAWRRGYYDVIWIARTHNLHGTCPILEKLFNNSESQPRMILDTEAIASIRESERARVEGRPFDLDSSIEKELSSGKFCDKIVAVTEVEATKLRDIGFSDVSVIGHMRTPCPTPRLFARRSGMLFIGAIHSMDSPNYDSLCWFVDKVMPLIEAELGWKTRLTVVGYTGVDVNLDRFRHHSRVTLRGAVLDLEPLYDSHLVFIAPTRFAAGAPYKVYEAASFGLPVVMTELLRRQLDWKDGYEALIAEVTDPETFARQVVALQRDDLLWQSLRNAALERIRLENNRENYVSAIADVLGPPHRG